MKPANKKRSDNKKSPKSTLPLPSPKIINYILFTAFALFSLWFLACDGANYLRKIDLLSIFLPTRDFFNDCMALPGGMLTWISLYLTQTFYHPWLGASIYTILLLLIAIASIKAFRLNAKSAPAAIVLPALTLLALLILGYVIFSLKTPGFAFLMPLGILFAVMLFWGYRAISNVWIRAFMIAIITIGGYCLMGVYGLLAAGLCVVYELTAIILRSSGHSLTSLAPIAIGVLLMWIGPKLWFALIGGDMLMVYIYTVPLPRIQEGEEYILNVYYIAFAWAAVLAIYSAFNQKSEKSGTGVWIHIASVVVAIASIVGVYMFSYEDENFRLTLDLDHAIWEQQWTSALDIVEAAQDFEPTRVNVMYTDIALMRSNQFADRAFTYRIGSAPYNTVRNIRATHDIISRLISLQTGFINYAYRWGVEYKVEHGLSVEQLKYMAKAAILNKDAGIARKCLENLMLTTFHRDWAKKYIKYLDDPSLIEQDGELSQIQPIIRTEEGFINDHNTLESYIWRRISDIYDGNFKEIELSLMGSLLTQDITDFIKKIDTYAQRTDRLPRHFQEGILIWKYVNPDYDISKYKIEKGVMERFKQFINAEKIYNKMDKEHRSQIMRQAFGDTYWYYYLYTENQTII